MALFKDVKCGRCDKHYSSIHSKCPYCGAKKNRDGKTVKINNTGWQVIVGLVVLILIIVAVVVLLAMSLKDREPEPGGATAKQRGIHGNRQSFCLSRRADPYASAHS